MRRFASYLAMTISLALPILLPEVLLAATTSFPSGSGPMVTDTIDGVTVTFSTTGSGGFSQWSDTDPSLRNVGFAAYTLEFSMPVTDLSFDIGGLDTDWDDHFWSFEADGDAAAITIGAPLNSSIIFNRHAAVWDGNQLYHGGNQDTGARVFLGSTAVTLLTFSSSGNWDSSHWVFFDNFSFEPVPEPATLSLLALGGLALIRRRKRHAFV